MTGVLKPMWRAVLHNLAWWWGMGSALAVAPTALNVEPVNQLVVAGNACGPAALLNAFRFGSSNWQRAASALDGSNDKERLLTIIREFGMRPSRDVPGHPRWSRRGVSVEDLRDIANQMTSGKFLPYLSAEVFFITAGESPEQLLQRVQRRLTTSLAKGFPPVISLRRYALRSQPAQPPQWVVIDAHFVTLTAIPRRLDKSDRTFVVSYLDPWGGRSLQGNIGIPPQPLFATPAGLAACLVADFPHTAVGLEKIRHGEATVLTVAAAIGRW